MMGHVRVACLTLALGFCGCASINADHFYVLQPLPDAPVTAHDTFATQVSLQLTLPSLVDRNELVVQQQSSVRVLEHERWGSPLADQIASVLGQDLERRRPDILITSRRAPDSATPYARIHVEIFDLKIQPDASARIEARWRIEQADGKADYGRGVFTAPGAGAEGFGRSVRALNQCVAGLADRLAQEITQR